MGRTSQTALGFTLIEVLLTMTILSLVMLSGAAAFNFMAQNWQRNQVVYARSLEQFEDWSLVSKSLANIVPKTTINDDNSGAGFYFLGRENGFTAVTNMAVQNPEYPAVFRLFKERNETGWQLVYEEASLQHVLLRQSSQVLPFNFRRVIATGVSTLEFEYYGWESYAFRAQAQGEMSSGGVPQWYDEFDGASRRQHPLVIQIHVDGFLWPLVVTDISQEVMERTIDEEL